MSKFERGIIINQEEKRVWEWIRKVGFPFASLNKALVNIERLTGNLTSRELAPSILTATARGIEGLQTLPQKGRESLLNLFYEAEGQIEPIVVYPYSQLKKPCLPMTGLVVVHPLEIGQNIGFREGNLWLDAVQSLIMISKLTGNPLCQQYVEEFLSRLPRIQQI